MRIRRQIIVIAEFKGENYYLSNFYPCRVEVDGIIYSSAEAAFQAGKVSSTIRPAFSVLSADAAKWLGHLVKIDEKRWMQERDSWMFYILTHKFSQNADLKIKLKQTGNQYLQEGNTWHDIYWGVDSQTGKGENKLGQLLMELRRQYISKERR